MIKKLGTGPSYHYRVTQKSRKRNFMKKQGIAERVFLKFSGKVPGWNLEYPADGYYLMTNDAKLSCGGAWRTSLQKGTLVRLYNLKVYVYDNITESFIEKATPVHGRQLSLRWNSTFDDGRLVLEFIKNSKRISEAKAQKIIESKVELQDGEWLIKDLLDVLPKLNKMHKVYVKFLTQ